MTSAPRSPSASSCTSRAANSATVSPSSTTPRTRPRASMPRSRPRTVATTKPCTSTTTSFVPSSTACPPQRSEEHTSELQSPCNLVCRLLLEKKKQPHRPARARQPLRIPVHSLLGGAPLVTLSRLAALGTVLEYATMRRLTLVHRDYFTPDAY